MCQPAPCVYVYITILESVNRRSFSAPCMREQRGRLINESISHCRGQLFCLNKRDDDECREREREAIFGPGGCSNTSDRCADRFEMCMLAILHRGLALRRRGVAILG